ncbi:TIGR04219 family outer membrane beta-barrel protein [Desulfurivibrio alkaliphilus]|uniref:TIGR04219 family outer membrane beta-barrel protein n=1 Tax=Desulfurivibrio alkaliphilus (strain DSM 19089 / UNIQEM U267 / AHT2) TaxID=589865 RepID=D6Z245_DESAT|nr:TIGR04219 family outer membrane beta-barrel protein [Desulfurivibrio alkaliphilus]ADH85620.1 conserved hypothetical protein [Desulfurivibrio alkaliphilus AHT 2]
MKQAACLLAALALLALPAKALALGLEVAVGVWSQSPSGDIGYEIDSSDDRLDLKRDAGFDRESRFTGRAKLELPIIPNIYLQATPMEFSGKGDKSVDFRFGDQTFDADVDFKSKLTLDQYDVALYYGLPLAGLATLGTVNIDLGLNLRFVSLKAEVDQPDTGFKESRSATLTVPMLYAGVQISPVDRFRLDLEGRYIAYSGNRYLDLVARLQGKISGPFFAAAGWRHQDIKIDARDIEGSLKVNGPFLETGFTF